MEEKHWCGGTLNIIQIGKDKVMKCIECGVERDYGEYLETQMDFHEAKNIPKNLV